MLFIKKCLVVVVLAIPFTIGFIMMFLFGGFFLGVDKAVKLFDR